ncbi:hypothetical protein [Amycolatopsis sp. CA-230715]|uniref:hypothetical protein n=1 Tax=Amycolatopsis sp. CA-230715 TaxID=2745196 RepID=UPI001C021EFF|nr:hypothetical protein [Amycolatopsis sp. CA-230715]
MAETKGQQVKHVVERVALGALAVGVEAMSSTKMALELRFDHVWRLWSPASRFPSLGRGPHAPGNLFWIGLLDSAGRRWASAAWGKDGRCPAVPARWLVAGGTGRLSGPFRSLVDERIQGGTGLAIRPGHSPHGLAVAVVIPALDGVGDGGARHFVVHQPHHRADQPLHDPTEVRLPHRPAIQGVPAGPVSR